MRIILYNILAFILIGCDRQTCKNINPIFEKYTYESNEYKQELFKQIQKQGGDNLEYWIAGYCTHGDNEYMILNIQSKKLCAKGLLNITKSKDNKLDNFKSTKGQSYIGAKVIGLKYKIDTALNHNELVFEKMTLIVD